MKKQTVLITGASSGIGYELSKVFAREGYDLVLVARSQEGLKRIADELQKKFSADVKWISKDLSQAQSPQELYDEVIRQSIQIDVLVNNAGFTSHGVFTQTDLKTEQDIMSLNIVTLTVLTKLFLRDMVQRGEGKVLNVSSTAAFQPGPLMAVYYASKAYVLWLSEAISEELAGSHITVTTLCPGPTRTGFQKRGKIERMRLLRFGMMDAGYVARKGFGGLMKGQTVVIPGFLNGLLIQLLRLSPRFLVRKVVKILQQFG